MVHSVEVKSIPDVDGLVVPLFRARWHRVVGSFLKRSSLVGSSLESPFPAGYDAGYTGYL